MKSDNVKKSIIAGGLVGTTGFLIAKAIGLLYSIPLSSILASDAYMSYYGSAYRIYSYLLNVFTAGAPMAIATMVAKYMTRQNYSTVLHLRRLSTLLLGCLGALGMIVMMAISPLIAPSMSEGAADGATVMTTVLLILSLAIFFVPILSAYRGFIQGCKEMNEYAFSQAFEQVFRVGFLLSVSCVLVYALKMDRVWALYAAVASTSVAAIAGIAQIALFARGQEKALKAMSLTQTVKAIPLKPLAKEFFWLAIPYLIFAILGYSNDIYDAILLPVGLKLSHYTPEQMQIMTSAVNYVGIKFTAIPMILSPGFVAAIIPHITSALEENDMKVVRKDIKDCINIVLFISLFLSFCIFLYAEPLFYTLYYTADLALSAESVRWIAIEGFFGTITPVITSLMMACRLRKTLIRRMFIAAVIKGVLMVPFVMWWGVAGAVMTTVISYGYIILFSIREMSSRFGVHFSLTWNILIKTCLGLACMALVAWVLSAAGLGSVSMRKIVCFLTLCVNGLLASAVFFGVEFFFRVPQTLFHFRFKKR